MRNRKHQVNQLTSIRSLPFTYSRRVKFSGKTPFSFVDSFTPISHPSSYVDKQLSKYKNILIILQQNLDAINTVVKSPCTENVYRIMPWTKTHLSNSLFLPLPSFRYGTCCWVHCIWWIINQLSALRQMLKTEVEVFFTLYINILNYLPTSQTTQFLPLHLVC